MKRPGQPRRTPLARGKSPSRSSLPARSSGIRRTPVKRSNTKRQKSEFIRCYGSAERKAWVSAQPSIVSGKGPCENVHTRGGGGSRKADACWIVPLTSTEHRELHDHGKQTFEAKYGLSLDFMAAHIEMRWQASLTSKAGQHG